jgi:hypothetical protein
LTFGTSKTIAKALDRLVEKKEIAKIACEIASVNSYSTPKTGFRNLR